MEELFEVNDISANGLVEAMHKKGKMGVADLLFFGVAALVRIAGQLEMLVEQKRDGKSSG